MVHRIEVKECPTCGNPTIIKEWQVSALEDRITGQFEAEVRRRARNAYLRVQREDPNEAAEMRRQYTIDECSEAYNWDDGGKNIVNHVREAKRKTWGAMFMTYLLMRRCDPSVTEKLATAIFSANPQDCMKAYLWALGMVQHPEGNDQAPTSNKAGAFKSESMNQTNQRAVTIPSEQGLSASSSNKEAPKEMVTFD